MSFEAGRKAKLEGKVASDNPFIIGFTKLGSPKLSEEGIAWELGFNSIGRVASAKEMNEAAKVDVSKFRRKSNRYYGRQKCGLANTLITPLAAINGNASVECLTPMMITGAGIVI